MTQRSIVLCADVSGRSAERSEMWLASAAETLSLTNSVVHVVLPGEETTDSPMRQLSEHHNVVLHPVPTVVGGATITTADAVSHLEVMVADVNASIVIVDGHTLAHACGESDVLSPRLWSHLTGLSFPLPTMTGTQLTRLREISTTSRRLLLQTEVCRSYVEAVIPEAAGKCLLMPPAVPDAAFRELDPPVDDSHELRLLHSGVLGPQWDVTKLTELTDGLEERGCRAELTMLGDDDLSDLWLPEQPGTGGSTPDVHSESGPSAGQRIQTQTAHDISLGSWTAAVIDPLSVPSEVMASAACGTPPLVKRTPANEALFGRDYPLFVDDDAAVGTVIANLLGARKQLPAIRSAAQRAVRPYARSATAQRLEAAFAHSEPNLRDFPLRDIRYKVVLAGPDLKFAGELIELLEARTDIELRIDRWGPNHDKDLSAELIEWADVIICEWAGLNAVWYSHHKRPGQRLVVRLHRYELTAAWIDDINIDKVDALITVSPHYQQLVRETKPWPPDVIHCIPNSLDAMDLDRPKHPNAAHSLAIVGIVPFLKRPDRALDLLESLLKHDPDFILHIKGRMPWEYPWAWSDPAERESYLDFFARLGNTPGLSEHVVFAPFSPDMANWLRGIGWVLSPSILESFHLAPAEGMASGALPLFWPREGVEGIYGDDYLFNSIEDMVSFVLASVRDEQDRAQHTEAVKKQVTAFDAKTVADMWMTHILPPPGE